MMRTALAVCFVLTALGCMSSTKTSEPNTTEKQVDVEQMIESVPLVLYGGGAGAGVLFKSSSKVGMITAAHVLADTCTEGNQTYGTAEIHIIGYAAGTERITYATRGNLVALDPKQDWAIVSVGTELPGMRFSIFADSLPKIGEDVWTVGSPLFDAGTLSRGIVSHPDRNPAICGDKELRFIHTDAAGTVGNSGGGLFDKNGICIGIVVRRNSISGTMYAVSTYYIHEWLHESLLSPDLSPPFIE